MGLRIPLAGALALLLVLTSLAGAETLQKGSLRVTLDGSIAPKALPREGLAPVRVAVSTTIAATGGKEVPQLRRISIAINRHGRLDPTGLPVCKMSDIQPATTQKALQACRDALVGQGSFAATVGLTRRVSFPRKGKMYAFNGEYKGKPAILAHVYGTDPVPTSTTLPFVIGRTGGAFATTLTATLPSAAGSVVTGLTLNLQRSFTYRGKRRSYASAGCPAPKGFPRASFSFARVSYAFTGGRNLTTTLVRSCKAR